MKVLFMIFARCMRLVLLILLIICLYNNHKINKHLETELAAQNQKQFKWETENIKAWTCGKIRKTDIVLVITPEYYEDVYVEDAKKIAQYNVSTKANYVLTAYKRGFKNPFRVAEDVAKLCKELRKEYKNLIIIGHSKAATINVAMLNYLSQDDYSKIVNISGTHSGTVLAMPERMREISLKKCFLGYNYGKLVYDYYENTFDGDLADQMIREDSSFLTKLDYSKVKKINGKFVNVISKVGIKSFFDDLLKCDFEGMGCLLMDNFLELEGDGIVPIKSQEIKGINSIIINASHKSSYEEGVKIILENM